MDRCLNGEETTLDGRKRVEKCFSCPYQSKYPQLYPTLSPQLYGGKSPTVWVAIYLTVEK